MSQKRLSTSDFEGDNDMRVDSVESMASAMRALSSQRGPEAGRLLVRGQEASLRGAESLLAFGRPTKAAIFAEHDCIWQNVGYLLHLIALYFIIICVRITVAYYTVALLL